MSTSEREWAAGKAFNSPGNVFKQLNVGEVGYAQWQTTDNQVNVSAITSAESTLIHRLQEAQLRIYAAGPADTAIDEVWPFRLALLRRTRRQRDSLGPIANVQRDPRR